MYPEYDHMSHICLFLDFAQLTVFIKDGSSMRMGVEFFFLKNSFLPENLNKLSRVFRLGMRKYFILDIEVIVFILTFLGNKRLNTQNDT